MARVVAESRPPLSRTTALGLLGCGCMGFLVCQSLLPRGRVSAALSRHGRRGGTPATGGRRPPALTSALTVPGPRYYALPPRIPRRPLGRSALARPGRWPYVVAPRELLPGSPGTAGILSCPPSR